MGGGGWGATGVKTAKTDPGAGGERVLEALIWSCGFSKRHAFVQAVGGGVSQPDLNPRRRYVCVSVFVCAFCKREDARERRRACLRSEDVSIVQMHVDSSACGGVCVNFACCVCVCVRELDPMFRISSSSFHQFIFFFRSFASILFLKPNFRVFISLVMIVYGKKKSLFLGQ